MTTPARTRRLATVDIGTNTVLMLVAECERGQPPRVLEERAEIVRLGQGIDKTGALDGAAIERTIGACRRFGDLARQHGAEVMAIGTQALREVRNATAFLGPARPALGGEIEIISGKREAQLAYKAVAGSLPELARDCVVVDIGGGSTEIIVAEGGAVKTKLSLKLGSVRLHERFLRSDPPSNDEWSAMIAHIDAELAQAGALPPSAPVIGIAGTVTTLAAIHAELDPYDPDRVHGSRLSADDVSAMTERLRRMPRAARLELKGLQPARADVIDSGAAILARVLLRQGGREVIVSDRGIRWGLLYERLEQLGFLGPAAG